jgi:hypothetical protein
LRRESSHGRFSFREVFACSLEPNQKGKAWISDLTETEEEVISASIRNATEMETYIESVTKNEIKWHFDVGTSKQIRTFFVSNPKTMVFVSGGKMIIPEREDGPCIIS